jgi:repressor LexA
MVYFLATIWRFVNCGCSSSLQRNAGGNKHLAEVHACTISRTGPVHERRPKTKHSLLQCGAVGEKTLKKIFLGSLFVRYNAEMSVTRRQKEVLDFLSNFVQRNGYSPSFEEIARGLGLKSLATVHKHITNLQKKGLLQRAHNRSRSIDVLPPRSKTRRSDRLPLLGRIAAGQPVDAAETSETIALADIIGNREVFALQVRGDSMRDEHIVDGDYVLVEHTSTARQGEIIVALVRGSETTLKRYYIEGTMVRLQPSNTEMEPIYVPLSQIAIQGRVLGVLRRYA